MVKVAFGRTNTSKTVGRLIQVSALLYAVAINLKISVLNGVDSKSIFYYT